MNAPDIENDGDCGVCFVVGRYVSWALLLFGGAVGGLPYLGLPPPPPAWDRASAYFMLAGLLVFALSIFMAKSVRAESR
jgi:hypothetical protein